MPHAVRRRASISAALLTGLAVLAGAWPAQAQTAQTRQVMREKLDRAGLLLAGLVTSNWASLEREGKALDALTNTPGWDVFRSPEYVRMTGNFHIATQALIDAAAARDQATALKAYTGVVSSCVACHQYVARARIVRLDLGEASPGHR